MKTATRARKLVPAAGAQLFVFELDDSYARRRVADKPNLYVGTSPDPDEHFARLVDGSDGPKVLRGRVVEPRPDLVVDGMSVQRLKKRLSNAGFNVKGMTDQVWCVYVIELDPARLRPHLAALDVKSWLYVGQTTKSPEQRFEEHVTDARSKDGKRRLASPLPQLAGWRLRPDLAPDGQFFSRKNALHQERRRADHLRSKGYWVHSA